jgi:hypothetical protein
MVKSPGIRLTMLVGPAAPVPAPIPLMEALRDVEVRHDDRGASAFQLTFTVGRSGPAGLVDYALMKNPLLRPFNRVLLVITIGPVPRVLMDGVITHQELAPADAPGASTLTVTGEDVSVMMDLEERSTEHPAQDETIIANKIVLSYARFGMVPLVIPPPVLDAPIPVERTPVQQGTDLDFLRRLAERFGYVFYVSPGPAPLVNTAYWGPPLRVGLPQRALSVNLGPLSNVTRIGFRNNALSPTLVEGEIQDRTSNRRMPVRTVGSLRPPLATQPAWAVNQPNVRVRQFRESGVNAMQALGRAQGTTEASSDAVTAEGELDTTRYGDLLQARGLVGLRGAGLSYDGLYYVKRVSHTLRQGEYRQSFTLTREGVGSTVPAVLP